MGAVSENAQNSYSGVDVLETLEEAANYNRYLAGLVVNRSTSGDRVIDFGAGTGTFAGLIESYGRTVSCIEIDPRLRSKLSSAGYQTYGAVDDLPPAGADVIYSFNVLEHIEDDSKAVQDLFGALKPGGLLILYVPALDMLMSSFDRRVGHLRRYRLPGLKKIVHEAGFDIIDARYADSLGVAAGLAYKLIDNGKGEISGTSVAIYDRVVFPLSRICDTVLHPFFGKNALVVGQKPRSAA